MTLPHQAPLYPIPDVLTPFGVLDQQASGGICCNPTKEGQSKKTFSESTRDSMAGVISMNKSTADSVVVPVSYNCTFCDLTCGTMAYWRKHHYTVHYKEGHKQSFKKKVDVHRSVREKRIYQAKKNKAAFDINVKVQGGGIVGQAFAIRLGIARALNALDSTNRPGLKQRGLLTRDARVKERRKYGLKKARKASQFSKR